MTDSLLPLLTVYSNKDDCKIGISTVLDIGSQNSFINSELAEQLKLEVVSSPLLLLIKGMNATRKLTTRSVKLPVKIGDKLLSLCCICIPNINIRFKSTNLGALTGIMNSKGIKFAYNKFNVMNSVDEVSDIKLLIGARDWAVVQQPKSRVIGPDHRQTAYYEVPEGIILVGSINDWICNMGYLGPYLGEDQADAQDSEVSYGVRQFQWDYECIGNLIESQETVDTLEVEANELVCDDILDLASYVDLDRTCDMFLNIELDNKGKDNEDIEREVTDFVLNNSYQHDDR